ncbi:hypothetical protein [Nostoc sp.]|uniref:hypothetical protein n=1 Tax=Nostoc sp. TaxID=1180 RepID=UPI002FF609CA
MSDHYSYSLGFADVLADFSESSYFTDDIKHYSDSNQPEEIIEKIVARANLKYNIKAEDFFIAIYEYKRSKTFISKLEERHYWVKDFIKINNNRIDLPDFVVKSTFDGAIIDYLEKFLGANLINKIFERIQKLKKKD